MVNFEVARYFKPIRNSQNQPQQKTYNLKKR